MTVSKVRPRTGQSGLWLEILVVVAITAIAVFLRYYQIGQVPPGFNSDEAVGAVGALETLRSGPQLYYAGQGGGGSLGFYIAAIGFALFGPSIAAIRGTAAFAGVVGVVATYFATREIFRGTTGMSRARLLGALAALGLAISLWHTQSSRVAFAAVGVPFLQVPGNYFLWRGMNTGRRVYFIISGVLLASLMYIYLSGSFAPFVYLFFFLLQWLVTAIQAKLQPRDGRDVPPPLIKRNFWNLVICAGVAFALFLPMVYFYLAVPDVATERAQQALFTNPLINQGDPWGTLWRSIWGNLAAFGFSPSWFQGHPPPNLIFPVPVSLLFLMGVALSLLRIAQPPYLFTLVFWGMMVIPSILSPDSIPHPLRAVGAAPAAYTLVAIGVMGVIEFGLWVTGRGTRMVGGRSKTAVRSHQPIGYLVPVILLLVLGLVVVGAVYQGFHYYLVEWPKTNDAQAAYHVYAVELAAEMSKETNPQATFLLPRDTAAGDVNPNYTVMFLYTGEAGYAWVVDDEDTLEATLNEAVQGRELVHVVQWKTSKHTGADPKEVIRYYLEKHGAVTGVQSFEYYNIETYRLDRLGPDLTDGALTPASIDFGGQIKLTGYAYGDASGAEEPSAPSVPAGDLLWVRLRLRMTAPIDKELKASVIITDDAGHMVGQVDKVLLNNLLHQDSEDWEPGTETDTYFLVPVVPASAPGEYRLGVAIYDADSFKRLPTQSGEPDDVVTMGPVAIRPDLSPPSKDTLGLDLVLDQPVTEELTLLGLANSADDTLRPGEQASVALVWRAEETLTDDYSASLWVDKAGDAWPLTDSLPLAGIDYPSSYWEAGHVVRGWFDGRVPPVLNSGDYTLGARVTDSDGALFTEVPLGLLRIQGWPRQFNVPPMQAALSANFGDQIELLGYDLLGLNEGTGALDVILYWRALSEMDVSYTAFVHLLDETGQVVSQVDHVPGDGAFPTTGWLPGEVVADGYRLPLAAAERTGVVEIGLYDPTTGERVPVLDEASNRLDDNVLFPLPSSETQ